MNNIAGARDRQLKRRKRSGAEARLAPVRKVKRLPPTAPAARDEGPRLLPLEETARESSRLEHYLDLADVALGLKKKSPQV